MPTQPCPLAGARELALDAFLLHAEEHDQAEDDGGPAVGRPSPGEPQLVLDVFLPLGRQEAGELVLYVGIVAGAERAEGGWGVQERELGSRGGGGDQKKLGVVGEEAWFGRG